MTKSVDSGASVLSTQLCAVKINQPLDYFEAVFKDGRKDQPTMGISKVQPEVGATHCPFVTGVRALFRLLACTQPQNLLPRQNSLHVASTK